MSETKLPSIRLLTEPAGEAGQHLVVQVSFDGADPVEVIRTYGALPSISIDHTVTPLGIRAALESCTPHPIGQQNEGAES